MVKHTVTQDRQRAAAKARRRYLLACAVFLPVFGASPLHAQDAGQLSGLRGGLDDTSDGSSGTSRGTGSNTFRDYADQVIEADSPILDPDNLPGGGTANSNGTQRRTDATQTGSVGALNPEAAPAGPVNGGGAGQEEDLDPFTPPPLRLGTFTGSITSTTTAGYSTNINGTPNATGGTFGRERIAATATSNWSRHQLGVEANLELRKSFSGTNNSRTEAEGNLLGNLRLDLVDGMTLDLSGTYGLTQEDETSINTVPGTSNRPLVHSFGAGAVLNRDVGLIGLQLRGRIDRTVYGALEFPAGVTVSQADRNETVLTGGLRASYDNGGMFSPFVDFELARGTRDQAVDASGFRRNYTRMRGSIGTDYVLRDTLTGSFSVGYGVQRFADARLTDLSDIVIDGSLSYSPLEDVTLTGTIGTSFGSATPPGQSGSVSYNAAGTVTYGLRDNLDLTTGLGLEVTNYSNNDRDVDLAATVGASYWFNPYVGVTGLVTHERQWTTRVGSAFSASSVEFGLTLRR